MWLWIGVGLGIFFAVSFVLGLLIGAMLGTISRGVTEMHEETFEAEAWALKPPSRSMDEVAEDEEAEKSTSSGEPERRIQGEGSPNGSARNV